MSFIKDGVIARDVYQHALTLIRHKKPDLEKNFVKSIGFGVCIIIHIIVLLIHESHFPQTGMEFRDSTYLLSPKNGRPLKKDMVLILGLGFTDLDDNGQKCILQF